MLGKLIQYLHFFIIMYAGWNGWELWNESEASYQSNLGRISIVENKIKKKRKELKSLEKYFVDIEEAERQIVIVMEQIKKLQRQLPDESDDLKNLQLLKDISLSVNLQNVLFKPAKQKLKEFYFITRYGIEASGTYLQLLLFFEQVSESKRMLNIPSVIIKQRKDKQRGRYTIVDAVINIESYRYNKKYIEKDSTKDIRDKYKNILGKKK